MKATADFFERIRVKPDPDATRPTGPRCDAPGCEHVGAHRAPKGRLREGEYFRFCLTHVRLYNQSYNYFSGMSDADVESYMKAAVTGHRPTWSIAGQSWTRNSAGDARFAYHFDDPHGTMGDPPPGFEHRQREETRPVRRLEQKAFDVLDLDQTATPAEIKTRYKELVKRHHPDANGGDRASEDKLRAVLAAYNHLKSAGFCG